MIKIKKRNSTKKILKEEENIEQLQKQELESLQQLKKEVEKNIGPHPLTKITKSDIGRSIVGALIGTIGHFAFFYGAELAERISLPRATLLYFFSLIVCFFFMYYSGFRKVKEIKVLRFIPIRMAIVYIISIIVVILSLLIFGFVDATSNFEYIYKIVASTLLLSVLGASTADILGKEE
jgi:uncharacterized membrane protein